LQGSIDADSVGGMGKHREASQKQAAESGTSCQESEGHNFALSL
jgi:hypothetical protein